MATHVHICTYHTLTYKDNGIWGLNDVTTGSTYIGKHGAWKSGKYARFKAKHSHLYKKKSL